MPSVIGIVVAAICAYYGYRIYKFFAHIKRMREMGALLPGSDEENPIFGTATIWAQMDTAGILDWQFQQADKLRADGHNVLRANFAHEVFVIPLDGEAIKPILESKEEIVKGLGYDDIREYLNNGLLVSDGKKWHTRRRLITPTFHFRHLESYVQSFNHHAKVFTEVISEFHGAEFDALPYIKRCALDIICDAAMGTTVNAQHNTKHPFVTALRDLLYVNTNRSLKAQLWFYPYYRFSGMEKLFKDALKTLHGFSRQVIAERKEKRALGQKTSGNQTSFLDLLLESYDAGDIDDQGVCEEVDTFMFEGHDTTSAGVAWGIWALAHHPEVQDKLYQEICDIVGGDDEPVTSEHLKNMPYLEQVLKETFRLFPPVPAVNRRLQADFQSGPYVFPKGAIVSIVPIILSRNKKVWGPDSLRFDPERFSEERGLKYGPFDYIPFSAGPRNCIGQKFALLETKVMFCWLVRTFLFSSSRRFEENRTGTEAVLVPTIGIPISAVRRI
ncbi:unnamed protein product, partial [Mesorhabditis spiculigera]